MEVINIDKDTRLVLDTQAKEVEININKCNVIITDVSSSIKTINVNEGTLDYCFIKKNDLDTSNNIIVFNGKGNINVIDILANSSSNDYNLRLKGIDSEIKFNVSTISRNEDIKNYKINSYNEVKNTNVKIDCFGICENKSCIKYDITSLIKKGAKQSIVDQTSKILLFDKESKGINNPILEIEENDVKANHGSSIGMIDEETLFYLTSRGIKEKDARNLVGLGKINYLINEVKEEKVKEDLLREVIERV